LLLRWPDKDAFDRASLTELKPVKLAGTMAFMFETRYPQHLTRCAARPAARMTRSMSCGVERNFDPTRSVWKRLG
jgi:homogentisate 1,2-dioxygenase